MTNAATNKSGMARDKSGAAILSAGELGRMHALAHDLYDQGEFLRGRDLLGAYLSSHRGEGSLWIHLQFHMMVFELATGDAVGALLRFETQIAPAVPRGDAPCDAPAAVWHLRLEGVEVDSEILGAIGSEASRGLRSGGKPVVMLHHILGLAACDDTRGLHEWLRQHGKRDACLHGCAHCQIARGLGALQRREIRAALRWLRSGIELLPEVGASLVQNEVFAAILRAIRTSGGGGPAAAAASLPGSVAASQ